MNDSSVDGGGAGRLGFVDLVLKTFSFLRGLGFEVGRRETTLVRFESGTMFVNVYHGRSSYQVGLELGRIAEGEMYSLHEILRSFAPAEVEVALCQTTDPVVLERCLATMAWIVEKNCGSLLAGDRGAFKRLDSVTARSRRSATIQAQFGAIVDRADRAWENKDFALAAELYEKASPALDETRMRRLAFLRSRKGREPT
jgi:hypothetical protein